jgi:hypothetical protein
VVTEDQLATMREAYKKFFRSHESDKPNFLSVEGTPSYFHSPEVPARVKSLLPNVSVVVALRNPVDRTISHFMGQKSKDFQKFKSCSLWFDQYAELVTRCDALRPAEKGFGGPTGLPLNDEWKGAWEAWSACVMDGDNPVARGVYAPALYKWLAQFPSEQIRVIQSEKL